MFGVVWTTLYTLMGVALALVWVSPNSTERTAALRLLFIQLAVNFAWSPIFFGARLIEIGLMTIVIMRRLMRHAVERTAFRDTAIPIDHGRRWWSISAKPLFDPEGRFHGWRGVGSDITETRLNGSDAVRAARLDPLTGVANRLLLREQLEEALLRQLGGDCDCALLLVDLDRFKLVNDTLGHSVGDQLLCEVAHRLEDCVGSEGVVGRLGGDEFAIVWRGSGDEETLGRLAEKVIAELTRTVSIGAADLHGRGPARRRLRRPRQRLDLFPVRGPESVGD